MSEKLVLRATELVHQLLARKLAPGDAALDATAGNGHDSCFLASLVGQKGRVFAFDIQPAACAATRKAASENGYAQIIRVVQDDHAQLEQYDLPALAAAVFNLGWLPGGDHSIITKGASTVKALAAAFAKLKPDGILVVTVYPGHGGGAEELAAVKAWLQTLPAQLADALEMSFPQKRNAPAVFLIEKAQEEG